MLESTPSPGNCPCPPEEPRLIPLCRCSALFLLPCTSVPVLLCPSSLAGEKGGSGAKRSSLACSLGCTGGGSRVQDSALAAQPMGYDDAGHNPRGAGKAGAHSFLCMVISEARKGNLRWCQKSDARRRQKGTKPERHRYPIMQTKHTKGRD